MSPAANLPAPDAAAPLLAEELDALRETLADQASAIDSLERRATMLMSPAAFVLGLAINNVSRATPRAISVALYYSGLAALIAAVLMGALVMWPRRPLDDATLSRGRTVDGNSAARAMAAASAWNYRDYRLKRVALRVQLTLLVIGACLVVGALGLVLT